MSETHCVWLGMDLLNRIRQSPLPFAEHLGIEIISAAPERIVGAMRVRPELCTEPAVLHGGAVMAFADTLGALGTVANLKEGTGTVTIESKTNFIAAAPVGSQIVASRRRCTSDGARWCGKRACRRTMASWSRWSRRRNS
jgi:uncharacterized protein (TIGR00369 family)